MWKMWYSQTGHRWQYGACVLCTGYQSYCYSTATVVCNNAPRCYVIRTLPVLVNILFYFIDYLKFSERANKINYKPCFDNQALPAYYELLRLICLHYLQSNSNCYKCLIYNLLVVLWRTVTNWRNYCDVI
jgi:hypothetical protein